MARFFYIHTKSKITRRAYFFMIDAVRNWLTSIIILTLFLSIAETLFPDGVIRQVGTFICGLVLMAAILQPLTNVNFRHFEMNFQAYQDEIEARQAELNEESQKELQKLIAERTAERIKAAASHDIQVSVEVRSHDGILTPWSVEIYGEYDIKLQEWIIKELNIPVERQKWTK